MSESFFSHRDEILRIQESYQCFKASSVDSSQRLVSERSELSSLLESLRVQLDKCKASALEERQKLRDERFDIGCLLAAESEKCEILEVKVRSLEERIRQLEEELAEKRK